MRSVKIENRSAMPFPLPVGHKFGCIAFTFVSVGRTLRDPIDLGDGIWVLFEPPFEFNNHWKEWLGSVRVEHLSRANFVILAHQASDTPGVADNENEQLKSKCFGVWCALCLADVFHHEGGLILSGANVDGGINIRQVSQLEPFYRPSGVSTTIIDESLIRRAATIATGIRAVHPGGHSSRLNRGFRAWRQGIMEYYGDSRLHQFVRSVEAVVKPDIGASTRQFIHRCQVFAGNSVANKELYGELYDLRGLAEHLHLFDERFKAYPKNEHDTIALRRAYQAQVLASHVYERIFSTPNLQTIFGLDDSIDKFWKEDWAHQTAAWGSRIDLEAVAAARYTRPF